MSEYNAEDYKKYLFSFSTKFSDIIRQLALTGVAISWLFLYQSQSAILHPIWFLPLVIFILSIVADAGYYYKRRIDFRRSDWDEVKGQVVIDKKNDLICHAIWQLRNILVLTGYLILAVLVCYQLFGAKTIHARGTVYNLQTRKPVSATLYYSIDGMQTGQKCMPTDSKGNFAIDFAPHKIYALRIMATGYVSEEEKFNSDSLLQNDGELQHLVYFLTPVTVDSAVVLKHVIFDFNSDKIREVSFPELEQVYRNLSDNPDLQLEVSGFTDNVGSDQFNRNLSERRAAAICDFLQRKGIAKDRLVAKGFGKSRPVALNDTEEHRQLNRRVEIRYLKIE